MSQRRCRAGAAPDRAEAAWARWQQPRQLRRPAKQAKARCPASALPAVSLKNKPLPPHFCLHPHAAPGPPCCYRCCSCCSSYELLQWVECAPSPFPMHSLASSGLADPERHPPAHARHPEAVVAPSPDDAGRVGAVPDLVREVEVGGGPGRGLHTVGLRPERKERKSLPVGVGSGGS